MPKGETIKSLCVIQKALVEKNIDRMIEEKNNDVLIKPGSKLFNQVEDILDEKDYPEGTVRRLMDKQMDVSSIIRT